MTLLLEFNQRKIILENSINCETYQAIINYKSDFDFMKELKMEFLPTSTGDCLISLKFLGIHLDLSLLGNIYNVTDGKKFVWSVDCDGKLFKANMSYSLTERIKTIQMIYLWSL